MAERLANEKISAVVSDSALVKLAESVAAERAEALEFVGSSALHAFTVDEWRALDTGTKKKILEIMHRRHRRNLDALNPRADAGEWTRVREAGGVYTVKNYVPFFEVKCVSAKPTDPRAEALATALRAPPFSGAGGR